MSVSTINKSFRLGFSALAVCISAYAGAQVTGGQHAFEFLNLPQSPHISALGGANVCDPMEEVSLALQNPSQMRPVLHNQLNLSYNNYYAGISIANLAYGYHLPKLNTSFILGIQYLKYGNFEAFDNIGNAIGTAQANDFSVSLGAAKTYGERWRYGAALKMAYSNYANNIASGLLADIGITYTDTSNLLALGATAKNMGTMLQHYPGSARETMPFDLQLGISKRFAHLPLRLMATVHHLYEWDIRYNNPADIESSSLIGTPDSTDYTKAHFSDKLFRHIILAAELSLGKRITIGVGYNQLHRGELAIKDKTAMAGFSFGATFHLNKFQVQYARTYYHIAGAYNEFGLNMALNRITGIGKTSTWNAIYKEKNL